MDDSVVVVVVIEGQISALSGVSVELTTDDLQKWTTIYKEDKGHIATYEKLCQGQKYEDFYLNQLRLMARMMGMAAYIQ